VRPWPELHAGARFRRRFAFRILAQMMADVFGTEIVEVNVTQGAAYGAALLAGVGTGVYTDRSRHASER